MTGLKIYFECSNFDFIAGFQGHNYYFKSWRLIAGVENAALVTQMNPNVTGYGLGLLLAGRVVIEGR